jgi:hypothetical protein
VPVLELSDRFPWQIVQGNTDPAPTCVQPWGSFLESSTPHFFAREDSRAENWDLTPMEWQNPPALDLYWFRWVLSHHIIFLCWHRIAQQKSSAEFIPLIKLCSLILLYAASCPNALYKKHIRTFMALYHRGFTAKWSLEHHAYQRTVGKMLKSELNTEALRSAYYEHKMVHMAVAKKFMGVAPSLLKLHSGGHGDLGDLTPETQFVYDAFFLVKRTEQPAHTLATAFQERLVQLHMDLQFNRFFPEDRIPKIFQGQRKIMALLDTKDGIIEEAIVSFCQRP